MADQHNEKKGGEDDGQKDKAKRKMGKQKSTTNTCFKLKK